MKISLLFKFQTSNLTLAHNPVLRFPNLFLKRIQLEATYFPFPRFDRSFAVGIAVAVLAVRLQTPVAG